MSGHIFLYNEEVAAPPPNRIDARTRYCAVLGHPVKHSASPAMQNAGIAALHLNWRYLAFDVPPERLQEAICGIKVMKFIGLNLTVPHKIFAMGMVDELDESGRRWGAINTIRFETRQGSGPWKPLGQVQTEEIDEVRSVGFNTDADAIVRALREDLGVEISGAEVLLLGAGGAGQTAALRLAEEKVSRIYLINRTRSKAEELAKEIQRRTPDVEIVIGYPKKSIDLLLNATSLGLKRHDPLPFDPKRFSLGFARSVYDMIYRPAETPLLKAAKAQGCKTGNGLGMLLYQGARALEIWTGSSAPIQVMRQALTEEVYGP